MDLSLNGMRRYNGYWLGTSQASATNNNCHIATCFSYFVIDEFN